MDKGFIKLSRSFFDNKIWQAARAFSECEAWLDLIQSARFEASPTTSRIGCYEVTWGRGQYPASNRFLAKKWGRSEQWVKSFLGKLKRERMITTDNGQGVNVITLVNFDKYNGEPDYNPPCNPANNPPKEIGNSELQELLTHLVTQQVTHLLENMGKQQPTSNPNNKKGEEYNNNPSLRGSGEPLCGTSPHVEAINYQGLVDFFNSETKGVFGTVRYPISDKRKGMINARIKEHGKSAFAEMVHKAYASDFLRGQNKNNFKATFDWLIKPTNFEKVISGNYDNRISNNETTTISPASWAGANGYARPSAGDKAASREAVGQFARAVLEKYKSQDGD